MPGKFMLALTLFFLPWTTFAASGTVNVSIDNSLDNIFVVTAAFRLLDDNYPTGPGVTDCGSGTFRPETHDYGSASGTYATFNYGIDSAPNINIGSYTYAGATYSSIGEERIFTKQIDLTAYQVDSQHYIAFNMFDLYGFYCNSTFNTNSFDGGQFVFKSIPFIVKLSGENKTALADLDGDGNFTDGSGSGGAGGSNNSNDNYADISSADNPADSNSNVGGSGSGSGTGKSPCP